MFAAAGPADGRTRVKICGITNTADALVAISAGADALGWNLFPGSKRFIAPGRAAALIAELPQTVSNIAIVVNPTFDEAVTFARCGCFAALQLHGAETPEFCHQLRRRGVPFAKALPLTGNAVPEQITEFGTDAIVLDSIADGVFGGTGRVVPWRRAGEIRARTPAVRVILAGGLTPENVAEAIRVVRPFGVDVSSGVEISPGRKDHGRLRDFIAAARSV